MIDILDFKVIYEKIKAHTLVDDRRCKILYDLLLETEYYPGDVWEGGVFRAGTAMLLATLTAKNKTLRLFDSFGEGMPKTDPENEDTHKQGDFNGIVFDEIINRVQSIKPNCTVQFHPGLIPETLKGLENSKISFAHADMDIYWSTRHFTEFVYPRLTDMGILIYDDFGFQSCKGCKKAVLEFYEDKPEKLEILETGQAFIRKNN